MSPAELELHRAALTSGCEERTMPFAYAAPRRVNGYVRTCRLVEIGVAHQRKPIAPKSLDEAVIQAALLAPPRPDGHWWAPVVCVLAAIVFLGFLL